MEKDGTFRRGLTEKLEIGAEIIVGVHRLVLTGEEDLLLENHSGILGFSAASVIVGVKGGALYIEGEGLKLPLLTENTLEIKGKIRKITFAEE